MQAVLPDDIKVTFEFDQSPYVTRAVAGVSPKGRSAQFSSADVLVFCAIGGAR